MVQILDFLRRQRNYGYGNKVFPFSQYDIQNVESAMTLEQGATETAYAAVYAQQPYQCFCHPLYRRFRYVQNRLRQPDQNV